MIEGFHLISHEPLAVLWTVSRRYVLTDEAQVYASHRCRDVFLASLHSVFVSAVFNLNAHCMTGLERVMMTLMSYISNIKASMLALGPPLGPTRSAVGKPHRLHRSASSLGGRANGAAGRASEPQVDVREPL